MMLGKKFGERSSWIIIRNLFSMIIQKDPHKGIFYHRATVSEVLPMGAGGFEFALWELQDSLG